ncbi:MAG: T9SS type A sorting domain-containing protein [Ignavibacteriaceae bacterium]|nr:T9SS type A sorting domain-containing protein [Ignavibacteriaceae bacterium]
MNWVCNTNNQVMTLAASGSVLYAGGLFTSIGGTSRNFIAAINANNGQVLSNWVPNAEDWVYKIVPYGSLIYVSGAFKYIGSQIPQPMRRGIAAINPDGTATPWNPDATFSGLRAIIYSIMVTESEVYAGGHFTHIGGADRNFIAAVDIETGDATDWDPNSNHWVFSIASSGSIIYLGGQFTQIGGQDRNYIAALDMSTGNVTNWNPNSGDAVLTFSVSGSNIYTGGRFFSIGGVNRNHIAAIDATTGQITNWNPYVEGEVQSPAGYTIGLVKKLDYQYSEFDDPLDPNLLYCDAGELTEPYVFSITVEGSTVLIGGQFNTVGGRTRNNIAAVNATTGTVIEDWDPNANGPIQAISVLDSIVYVGGDFTNIGNSNRYRIAALDFGTGDAIEDWSANANYFVRTITVSDSRVYAGGAFTSIGGENRNYIAALDIETGSVIENWDPSAEDWVYSLAFDNSILYVGGEFTSIGNESRNRIAALDAESGRVTNWDPDASGGGPPETIIYSLIAFGSTVYAAGSFTSIGEEERKSLAALDVETGKATDWDPNPRYPAIPFPSEVYALAISPTGTQIYAGGFFVEINDKVQSYFAGVTGDGLTVVTNSLIQGWQTLSVPVVVDDFAKTSVWPTADPNSYAYSFCGTGYVPEETLENGVGYYVKFNSPQDIFYAGEFLQQFETPVCAGWNIVGSLSEEVPVSTNVCLYPEENSFESRFFIYRNGYEEVNTIKPGMGYWIKVALSGSLLVNIDPIQCYSDSPESIEEEGMDHFRITDATGKQQDLYVANLDLNPSLGGMDLSIPPPLPEVGFDARFAQDDYIKPVSPDSGEVELEINVETQAYPITLSWELNPANGITYSFISDSGVGKVSNIKSNNGNISLYKTTNNKIRLIASAEKISNSTNLPTVYSLMQNYPNPFNPTTIIKYSLPKVSDVKLIVYDILGREVAVLINNQQQPGRYEIKWEASNVSSGIYFYSISAGNFQQTKKMILLK